MESGPQGGEVVLDLDVYADSELHDLDAEPTFEIHDPDDTVVETGTGAHLSTGRYRVVHAIGSADQISEDWSIVWAGTITVDPFPPDDVDRVETFAVTGSPPSGGSGTGFRRLLERTVTIIPRIVDAGRDAHGNETRIDGTPIEDVPCARDLLKATEDVSGADRQEQTFTYVFPAYLDSGAELALTGYDRIVDTDGTFEVRGEPAVVVRRRDHTKHHLEAIAYRVEG